MEGQRWGEQIDSLDEEREHRPAVEKWLYLFVHA